MTGDNLRPYILVYKSSVKITISWVQLYFIIMIFDEDGKRREIQIYDK